MSCAVITSSSDVLFYLARDLPCHHICVLSLTLPRAAAAKQKFTPLPWTDFFSEELYFDRTDGDLVVRHHAYLAPPMPDGPLFVTHHGAGSSGLSFAALTSELQRVLPKAGVLSLDARGHGSTTIVSATTPNPPIDLSLDTLATDLAYVLNQALSRSNVSAPPPVILIGHSLGGAVVSHAAHNRLLNPAPLGYCVLDVVEGSAIDALVSMESYLSTRPASFPSLPSAIEWHIRSRTIRNTRSACVSVPALLKHPNPSSTVFTWLTDLTATKPYWPSWFTGLSSKFLNTPGPAKLLLLAGTDRLDKELMVSTSLLVHPHTLILNSHDILMPTDRPNAREIPDADLP